MRVVLGEDLVLLRDGLETALSAHGFDVVAAVASGPELAAAIASQRPDVAVVDVRLPPTFTDEGLRVALAIRQERPGFPVLVLSQYVERLYARELLASGDGAVGYLLKDRVSATDDFVDAVRTVAAGGTVMDPEVVAKLLSRGDARGRTSSLRDREREVLAEMAKGRSNAAIAGHLGVSTSAVTKHIAGVFDKLGLAASDDANRRVLAVLAYLDR